MTDLFDAAAMYDEDYLRFFAVQGNDPRSDADADLIWRLLDLRPGMTVLDLACGHGRIANRLAARGCHVTGLDSSAVTEFGGLDIVHLNAGTGGAGGAGEDFDLQRYRRTLAVNIDGTMFGIRAALPVLTSAGGGAIVVTSSIAGIAPSPFDPVYSASKHAIIGLVRSLGLAWAKSGVTINAVCPGFVGTPILPRELRDEVVRRGFAIADPAEVAEAVESIARGSETGRAWVIQAGRPLTPVEFPRIELSRIE